MKSNKILWIYGKSGCGKTTLADSIIKKFREEGKVFLKLAGKDFVALLVDRARRRIPIDDFIFHFRNYELLVIDDLDYALLSRTFTQGEAKDIIQAIIIKNGTKVILITQERPEKLEKLKFESNYCEYLRINSRSTKFKTKLVKELLDNKKINISDDEIKEITKKSDNLFQLKGRVNRFLFFMKYKVK